MEEKFNEMWNGVKEFWTLITKKEVSNNNFTVYEIIGVLLAMLVVVFAFRKPLWRMFRKIGGGSKRRYYRRPRVIYRRSYSRRRR